MFKTSGDNIVRTFVFSLVATLLLAVAAEAQPEDLGPAIGSQIPHDLTVSDETGNSRSFADLTGENGAVLVFYRSAKWCPFCQRQLITLEKDAAEAVRAKGYNLVGISYDNVSVLANFKAKNNLSYPLLYDEGSKIIDAFGVRNEAHKEGHFAYGIPHPIIVVTDKEGIVKAKLFEKGYRDRPEAEVILSTLDEVQAD